MIDFVEVGVGWLFEIVIVIVKYSACGQKIMFTVVMKPISNDSKL